jgi:hypothetical protein
MEAMLDKAKKELNNQEIIALLDVYLNEFIHRNHMLWSQVFKFFYASIIVMLLPNLSDFLGITLPSFPILMFRIIGAIMTVAFFYISIGYAKRLEASTKTYNRIIDKLDIGYQRIKINDLKFGQLFSLRTSYILIYLLFLSLVAINILMFFYST